MLPKTSSFFFLLLTLLAQSHATEWDPKMEPALGLAFPLEVKKDRVVLSQDLLLTPDKVLPAGTVLRTIFRPVTLTEGEKKTRRGVDEDSFSRVAPKVTTKGLMTETERKVMDRAYGTVWTNPIDFRRTLELTTPDNLRFVLEPAPGVTPPPVEIPSFPDGLCVVGNPSPHILSVLKESPGAKAGFRGGDSILEIAGQPAGDNLTEFATRFKAARENAAKKRADVRFKVRRSTGECESLVLHVPPSWNSAFEE
ncbi:MAG: hypothetical protein EBT75_05625 [Proteobacteria bacterium]|nr:hypothetical protein [Pseudomonadota bacterium]NBS50656.1 hypothetical protein [Verrucomicrobiota bacterium]NBT24407.1 hypothetical protein [bacterium]NBV97366.1 hypothetical protein [Verrucomicrobiota bacterium]